VRDWKVVQSENFGGDYPNEFFVEGGPSTNQQQAEQLAQLLNSFVPEHHNRYWKAVPPDYKLQPGFEP
jgi:hypothetical protein